MICNISIGIVINLIYQLLLLAIPNSLKETKISHKDLIVSIITMSQGPMTVKQVLESFKVKYGYSFPFEKHSCRTCMDYFRLFPALFKVHTIKSND